MNGDSASKSFTARAAPLTWLNLVCLDAPLVAISWQWLLAESTGVAVPLTHRAALFLTAWLIYLADRFGDSCSLVTTARMSLRQRFCRQHRRTWLFAVGGVAVIDALVIGLGFDRSATLAGAAVGGTAILYLVVNRFRPSCWEIVPLKEVSIGTVFASGVFISLAPGLESLPGSSWLLFTGLCSLNCICIAVWERELDEAQARITIATRFPIVRYLLLPTLALLAGVSIVCALLEPRTRGFAFCVSVSAALLGAIHCARNRIADDSRTALADLVLLTPLVPLLAKVFG